jgi:hypothetical protein
LARVDVPVTDVRPMLIVDQSTHGEGEGVGRAMNPCPRGIVLTLRGNALGKGVETALDILVDTGAAHEEGEVEIATRYMGAGVAIGHEAVHRIGQLLRHKTGKSSGHDVCAIGGDVHGERGRWLR